MVFKYPKSNKRKMKQKGEMRYGKRIEVLTLKPHNNPYIGVSKLNPVTQYSADVYNSEGKKVETLTGVSFGDKSVKETVQHHASVRGHGSIDNVQIQEVR